MATNCFSSDETRRRAISATRGDYQYSVLVGGESWSGSTLRGAAKNYAGRYRDSRASLLAVLRAEFDVEETVDGRAKAYKISERAPLDLKPKGKVTKKLIQVLGLEPQTPRDIRILRAEHVEDRDGSAILLATVFADDIEGTPKVGPTLRVTEKVYVVARHDKDCKPVVRDTLRKARSSAKDIRAKMEAREAERQRVAAANEAAAARRAQIEREKAEAAATPKLTDADMDAVADAFA